MVERPDSRISGRIVLALFVVTNILYASMLTYSLPAVAQYAPGLTLFDLSPGGYSYDQALILLSALGATGRDVYLKVQLPLDFIYPALFALTYSLLIVWALQRYPYLSRKVRWLALLPILAGLFDYAENVGIIMMLTRFPELPEGLVRAASFFTVVKSACTTVYFIGLLLVLVFVLAKQIKSRGVQSG